jgi:2-phosphosulfolactate phosphatase
MRIIKKSLADGASEARGLVVIIDVFRAFTCEPILFHFGVKKVVLEADPAKAIQLKKRYPEFILIGEINEVPIEGGDLGNSPSEIMLKGEGFFKDKTVVHRTTAGVTGATAALENAEEVLLGSFVMAKAISEYIIKKDPDLVTLVAMGERAKGKAPEDEACADYLEHLLTGRTYDFINALKAIIFQPTAQKFIQGKKTYLPVEDPIFCLQRDLFGFVLRVEREGDCLVVLQES